MDQYEHITRMEEIKNTQERLVEELEEFLGRIEARQEDYQTLIAYYYSEQRRQDLRDDERGLIPQALRRGVLSEDELYELMGECYGVGLRMIEAGLKLIKTGA